MSAPPVVVADFDVSERPLGSRARLAAAARAGAAWVAVEADDDLAATARDARRRGLGLLVRVRETSEVEGLRESLGVAEGDSVAALRERLLVVVARERVGRRLHADARELPSARELAGPPHGFAGFLERRLPNFLRASSDADDLVVPLGRFGAAEFVRLAEKLGRRGARLWLSEVPPGRVAEAARLPASGLLVRHPAPLFRSGPGTGRPDIE